VTLIDAGPLVAILHRDDRRHRECVEVLRTLAPPLGTTWPVITEAMYLLAFSAEAQEELWGLLEDGRLTLLGLDASDAPRMRALMRKYRDLPMDLADASLVAIAEREGLGHVFTLDRRDFGVYRLGRRGRFAIVP
jgi:predicted nucleic acid-binding protein